MNEDYKYNPRNREKIMQFKSGTHWCLGCDANLINSGEKCCVCGHRERVSHGNRNKRRRRIREFRLD